MDYSVSAKMRSRSSGVLGMSTVNAEVNKNEESYLDAHISNEGAGRFAHHQKEMYFRGSCLLEGGRRRSGLEGTMEQNKDNYPLPKLHYM